MLILASPTDKLQLVTSAGGSINVHASFLDNISGSVLPGRQNSRIVTAAITDIVAPPGSSIYRNLKTLHVYNAGGANNNVTVRHTDGTTVIELHKVTLPPGGTLQYVDEVGFLINQPSPLPQTLPGTGDLRLTHKTVADLGWVMWVDGTIGDNASGASVRADADTAALFDLYYSYTGEIAQTCAMTIASPAVVTATGHGLFVDQRVTFTSTGALPTGITSGSNYYVIATGLTADAFQVSATPGGAAVNTTGTQSGIHTVHKHLELTLQDSTGAVTVRGANAAADFAAHRRLFMPPVSGRALAVAGLGAGLTMRALGSAPGLESVTPSVATTAPHAHIFFGGQTGAQNGPLGAGAYWNQNMDFSGPHGVEGLYMLPAGGGQPFPVMQPTAFVNVMVKL